MAVFAWSSGLIKLIEIMGLPEIQIRREVPGDVPQIRRVNELAFGRRAEADVIDRLRRVCPDFISFVAALKGQILGHILFTPAWLGAANSRVDGMGLAPLAVLPEFQNQGIGGSLIQAGLLEIQKCGWPFVIVLSHPGYYPRFGFETASRHDIRCEYEDMPNESFMIRVFNPSRLPSEGSVAYYCPEWAEAT